MANSSFIIFTMLLLNTNFESSNFGLVKQIYVYNKKTKKKNEEKNLEKWKKSKGRMNQKKTHNGKVLRLYVSVMQSFFSSSAFTPMLCDVPFMYLRNNAFNSFYPPKGEIHFSLGVSV